MRRRDLVVPPVVLDRESSRPLYEQISRQVAESIRNGGIPNGARLPSTRMLAKVLGISRNTALTAYDELAAANLIRGNPGSGMRVSGELLAKGMHATDLQSVIRAAHFPAKILSFTDPDGNPLYLSV